MYIIKNAFQNLGRNKGRNVLLGIIMFIIILSSTIALVINTTTNAIISDYKTRFGSEVTLRVNFDKLMEETQPNEDGTVNFPTAPEIHSEQYLEFANSEYLKSYLLRANVGIAFHNLTAVGDTKDKGMKESIGGNQEAYIAPKAKLVSYSDVTKLPDFKEGLRKIIEGKVYQEKNECLISSDFANLNSLKINDELKIVDTNTKNEIHLKVAGIYADATKENGDIPEGGMSFMGSFGNRRNEIIVNMDTVIENFEFNSVVVHAEYELLSPNLVKDFETELREKGLPSAYIVETDEVGYQKIVAPVEGLSEISMTFMWVVLAIGGAILLFITAMAIRERKYEIGVLRAMGLKKSKIGAMFMTEMIMITMLCLGIGLGLGSVLAQPVANSLLEVQKKEADNYQEMQNSISIVGEDITMNKENNHEELSDMAVSLSAEAMFQICVIASLLALLSSIIGVYFITKYEPMRILSERN